MYNQFYELKETIENNKSFKINGEEVKISDGFWRLNNFNMDKIEVAMCVGGELYINKKVEILD